MFGLEDVIRTPYGFDFFMRHLVKEFCHGLFVFFFFACANILHILIVPHFLFQVIGKISTDLYNLFFYVCLWNIDLENLLSFYEMEKFQEVVLAELQVQYDGTYRDTHSLVLIGFPKELPVPYILTYPIEVQVVLLDQTTEADGEREDPAEKEQSKEKAENNKEKPEQSLSKLKKRNFEKLNQDEDSKEEDITDADEIEYEKKMIEYKKRTYDLFLKYVKVGASHEINISSASRNRYQQLMGDYQKWKDNEKYGTKEDLLHLFDDCKKECWKLLGFVFTRFEKTVLYKKWLQQRLADEKTEKE
ncbi:hypothetical protein RFI_33809 [Reticulomyxa filosa]|uniref:RGS domain-containing protein n=1 Tax=Reticulomyxa filosa TaxID=46433 RepID=X6LS64_RETFI|nr:hypothetical protein RFI_33809 [Reticulomyxa filosa]|eukprot:ETO03595.1 hypothetical protein RFI_33809 [Reticulomyxa filosa]